MRNSLGRTKCRTLQRIHGNSLQYTREFVFNKQSLITTNDVSRLTNLLSYCVLFLIRSVYYDNCRQNFCNSQTYMGTNEHRQKKISGCKSSALRTRLNGTECWKGTKLISQRLEHRCLPKIAIICYLAKYSLEHTATAFTLNKSNLINQ